MFSFLNPIFLWAATAALIPLILHLMQRRRIVRMRFSTLRFLKLAEKRSSNRIRMENLLLWLLRTLVLVLLALAFAMPMLRTRSFGEWLGRSSRDAAIVINASYSMGYRLGRDTVWDRAIQAAVDIIQGLEDGDRVCVLVAADDVQPVVAMLTEDRDFAVSQVKTLRLGATSSQLAPAVLAAYDALRQDQRRREREIHILTDGQHLPWRSFTQIVTNAPGRDAAASQEQAPAEIASALNTWDPSKLDRRTAFFAALLGAEEPCNAAPLDVAVDPPLIMADMPSKVSVRLGQNGPRRSASVSLYLDGAEAARRAVDLGGSTAGEVLFAVPPLPAGLHVGRAEVAVDNLEIDDAFHFMFRVRDRLPVLCVGTEDDCFYLLRALRTSARVASAIDVKRAAADAVTGETLSAYSCVFLCNALPLPGQAIVALEQYARTGGLLAFFPGANGAVSDYASWSCLPAVPTAVVDVPDSARKQAMRWAKPQHPILRTIVDGHAPAPILTIRQALQWEVLHPSAEVLVNAGPDRAFLLCRPFGSGRVLLCAVAADRSWSDFPLSPFFLPLLHQIVRFGAGVSSTPPYVQASRRLSLADVLPGAAANTDLRDPSGDAVSLRASVEDNRTLVYAENLLVPGIYTMPSTNGAAAPALAVNVDRIESDLTPAKKQDVERFIGARRISVAHSVDELVKQIVEFRMGRTLGEFALWLALIAAVAEVLYANSKARRIAPLSETLRTDASGRLRSAKAANDAGEPDAGGRR